MYIETMDEQVQLYHYENTSAKLITAIGADIWGLQTTASLPFETFSTGSMEEFPLDVIEGEIYPNAAGFQYAAREIRRCLLEGKSKILEAPFHIHF